MPQSLPGLSSGMPWPAAAYGVCAVSYIIEVNVHNAPDNTYYTLTSANSSHTFISPSSQWIISHSQLDPSNTG